MIFGAPQILPLAAVLLPILGCFLVWAWRRKQRLVGQFVQSKLLSTLTIGVSLQRQKLRLVLVFAAAAFLLLSLARPQWGFEWQEARQQGLDILVAVDTSRSMLAEDIRPNRLARAKMAVLDLMKAAKTDRLGLIAFAGSAFLECPLTHDEEAFRESLEALNAGIIPQGGTSLGDAIDTAVAAFGKNDGNHRVLVLFTDGEDHDSEALQAAERAAKAGLKIFTIGVGTSEGELLRTFDEQGNPVYLKDDQGQVVKSHLNETLLRQIATASGAFYLPLQGARPIETLYARGLASLPKSEANAITTRVLHERYHWFVALAIVLLLLELFLPNRRLSLGGVRPGVLGNAGLRDSLGAAE